MNAFMKTMSKILINDLVEELSEENSRLLSHLLFANKCLLQLKTHLIDIHFKYETIITSQDKQVFKTVIQLLDSNDVKTTLPEHKYSLTKTRNSRSDVRTGNRHTVNGDKHKTSAHPEVDQNVSEWSDGMKNEDSDESYVENNTKNKTNLKTNKTKFNATAKSGSDAKNKTHNKCPKVGTSGQSPGDREHVCGHMGCDKTFAERSLLQKHRKTYHTIKPYKCDYKDCDSEFRYKCLLLSHRKIHTKPTEKLRQKRRQCFDTITDSYICSQSDCHQRFKSYSGLQTHIRDVHSGRRYACDYPECDMRYKTLVSLKYHKRSAHENLRPYRCPHPGCTHSATAKDHLKKHVAIHLEDRQLYSCEHQDCGRSFKSATGLRSHVNLMHTDSPYACPIQGCERRYGGSSGLRHHMRMCHYSSEPTFRCGRNGCPEVFSSEHYLKKHRVSVHNERPINRNKRNITTVSCVWPGCDYTCAKYKLQKHMDLHTGAKPYACDWPECGKRFRLPKCLTEHKNVHNNVKPYGCQWPGCQYRCSNSGNLVKHVKNLHRK